MDSLMAMMKGIANRGGSLMVFDWDKAAKIIREKKLEIAGAGLQNDWEWTGGNIYEKGKPIPKDEVYTYLASTWAIPELSLDGKITECFIMKDEVPEEWGKDYAHIYWPQSALDILNGE